MSDHHPIKACPEAPESEGRPQPEFHPPGAYFTTPGHRPYDPHRPYQYPPPTSEVGWKARAEWLEVEIERERKLRKQLQQEMLSIRRQAAAAIEGFEQTLNQR